jgi:hypothetical protein
MESRASRQVRPTFYVWPLPSPAAGDLRWAMTRLVGYASRPWAERLSRRKTKMVASSFAASIDHFSSGRDGWTVGKLEALDADGFVDCADLGYMRYFWTLTVMNFSCPRTRRLRTPTVFQEFLRAMHGSSPPLMAKT